MAKTTAQDSNEKQGQREMKWAQASNEKDVRRNEMAETSAQAGNEK